PLLQSPINGVSLLGLDISPRSDSGPTPAFDIQSAIKCYALPYGAFGCISHALTYYSLVCLWFGRSPVPPWRKLSYKTYNFIIASIGPAISLGMSVTTIVKCKHTWPFLTLAAWKTSLSLLAGVTGIHAAHAMNKSGGTTTQGAMYSMWWAAIYFFGMVVGMAGLIFIVIQALRRHQKDVTILTAVFFVVVFLGASNT
ncbi:hypothetical protein P691DRAFT_676764, partial [Macrolepiota fuliginosa MF-IS2]